MDPALQATITGMGFTPVQAQTMAQQGLVDVNSFLILDNGGIDDIMGQLFGVRAISKCALRR